jgi:hypothetical protein
VVVVVQAAIPVLANSGTLAITRRHFFQIRIYAEDVMGLTSGAGM